MATEWIGDDFGALSGGDGIAKCFSDKTIIGFSLKARCVACGERVVVVTYCGKQSVPGRITVFNFDIKWAVFVNECGWEVDRLRLRNGPDGAGKVLHFYEEDSFLMYRFPVVEWERIIKKLTELKNAS